MLRRVIIVFTIILVVALALFVWNQARVPLVDYVTVREEEAVRTLLLSGRVSSEGAVPLSFKQSGQIVELSVSQGDSVVSGAVLARLDDRQALNIIAQNESSLESARVALSRLRSRDLPQAREAYEQARSRAAIADSTVEGAVNDLVRPARENLHDAEIDERRELNHYLDLQILYRSGAVSHNSLEEAREEWELARANLELAREELERAEREVDNLSRERDIARSQERSSRAALNSLENEEIRQAVLSVQQAENRLEQARLDLKQVALEAPFSGVVTAVSLREGQFASPGQEVLTLMPSSSKTIIAVQVDEDFAGIVQPGLEARVSSTAFPERFFTGNLDSVSPTVDPARGTFEARIALDSFEPELIPDLAVTAELIVAREGASLIIEHGQTISEGNSVFVLLERDGQVVRRAITVEDLGGGLYRVLEGLAAGDRVLRDLTLSEGAQVRLKE